MLLRRLLPLGLLCVLVGLGPGCTAELEEGCLGGECVPPGTPPIPPPPSGSSSGGGGSGGGLSCETTPATGDFPCDVFAVLEANCHSCHQSPPLFGAPYSLLTYEDTREFAGMTTIPRWVRVGAVVESNFMPLGTTMPADDKKILLDWVAACAPPADAMGCE